MKAHISERNPILFFFTRQITKTIKRLSKRLQINSLSPCKSEAVLSASISFRPCLFWHVCVRVGVFADSV